MEERRFTLQSIPVKEEGKEVISLSTRKPGESTFYLKEGEHYKIEGDVITLYKIV